MRERAMQLGNRTVARLVQMTQDVRLGLRQSRRVLLNENADAVRGAVNAENELKTDHTPAYAMNSHTGPLSVHPVL